MAPPRVPIFTTTSLGTRIAMEIPPDATAQHFKSEFERAHFNCFPDMGEIKVHRLKVKQRSCFYHLPNSMPLRYACQRVKGGWFLIADASTSVALNQTDSPESAAADARIGASGCISSADCVGSEKHMTSITEKSKKRKAKTKQIKKCDFKKGMGGVHISTLPTKMTIKSDKQMRVCRNDHLDCGTNRTEKGCCGKEMSDHSSEKSSPVFASKHEGEQREQDTRPWVEKSSSKSSKEVVSVTGIIRRYFSDFHEMEDNSPACSDFMSRAIIKQSEEVDCKTDEYCCKSRDDVAGVSSPYTEKTPQRTPLRFPAGLVATESTITSETPRRLPLSDQTGSAVKALPKLTPKTPRTRHHPVPRPTSPMTLKGRVKSYEVGSWILTACSSLSVSASKQNPGISLCRYKHSRSTGTPQRHSVFEVSDSEEN